MTRVLISYSAGPLGEAAFDAGIQEALRRGEPMTVLNSPRRGKWIDTDLLDDSGIRELTVRASEQGVEVEFAQPVHDDLVSTIEDFVDTSEYSVLVMGIRRRSQVGKVLLGSTAQRILLQCEIPIVAVKS